jgi:hypothetical protein
MTTLYAKQTMNQRREGARKRLAARTKAADLSESTGNACRNEVSEIA